MKNTKMKKHKTFSWKRVVSMMLAIVLITSSTYGEFTPWENVAYAAEGESTEDSSQGVSEEISENLPENSSEQIPENPSEQIQENLPEETLQIPAEEIPGNEPENPLDEIPPNNVENLTDNMRAIGGWPILVNGASAVSDQDFTNAISVSYGEPVNFSLEGYTGSSTLPQYYYRAYTDGTVDSMGWKPWVEGLIPGRYYLGYSFSYEGANHHEASGQYGLKIDKAILDAPKNLVWQTGSTASWAPVTTDEKGNVLENGTLAGYEVTLYQNGTEVSKKTVSATDTTIGFAQDILEKGAGSYTFEVRSLVATAKEICYTSSAVSEKSGITHAVAVTLKGDAGVASVEPADSFIVIPGDATYGTKTIKTVMKSDLFHFKEWHCEQEGIIITTKENSSATLQIATDYTGSDAIQITARTTTTIVPTISVFEASEGAQYGKLQAKASDTVSGITAYAFSTVANAVDIPEG